MQELQSVADVFHNRILRIPDYQRGYAWGEKQLRDFWTDLVNLSDGRYHYTGVISLKEVKGDSVRLDERWLLEQRQHRAFQVVDGQQRLATFAILIQALVEIVGSLPQHQKEADKDIYLGAYSLERIKEEYLVISQPPRHIIRTYKLGYDTDNPSFQFLKHRIFGEPAGGSIEESFYTLNLENAKNLFHRWLQDTYKEKGVTGLQALFHSLTTQFKFNVFELSDDFDVHVAFETMNNRGKSLSDLELLKNRLIYLITLYQDDDIKEDVRSTIRKNINDAWREAYAHLGRQKTRPLNDNDFLRAHWITYFRYSRRAGRQYARFLLEDYFSPLKVLQKTSIVHDMTDVEEVRDEEDAAYDEDNGTGEVETQTAVGKRKPEDINKYVLSLKTCARPWYNIHFPQNATGELSKEEQRWMDKLDRLGVAYFRPLILAAYMRSDIGSAERASLLRAIERFVFIAFRVLRTYSNYGSSKYYGAASDLFHKRGRYSSLGNVVAEIEGETARDGTFDASPFLRHIDRQYHDGNGGFYAWNGLRYFLFEYEEHLREAMGEQKLSWDYFVKQESDKVSIEHVLPQTPGPEWKKGFESYLGNIEVLQGTLGNLLPLSMVVNNRLQNDPFEEKKKEKYDDRGNMIRRGYGNGSYSEIEVARNSDWTAKEIMERGLKLLDFLESRWRINIGGRSEKLKLLKLEFLAPAADEIGEAGRV